MSDEKIENQIQPEDTKKRSRYSWMHIGILCSAFSIIVLIVAGGYSCWYLMSANMQLAAASAESQHQLQQLQSNFNALQTATSTIQQDTQQTVDDVKNLKQTLTTLSQEKQGNQEKWLLAEARYYAKFANDNLQFSHNVPLAIYLLKMADQEIRPLADPKIIEIRKAIAADIASLQAVPLLDVAGLYMKLTAINDLLEQLPLQLNQQEQHTSSVANQNETKWQRIWRQLWQSLHGMIVIRYNTNGTMPLVTPEQKALLYLNLHAVLSQSIWGLLNQQPAIYQTSLRQLTVLIKQYVVLNAPQTQTVLNELAALEKIDIHPPALLLTNSVQAFNGV